MQDLSYVDALESAPEPHRVLLGPVPCKRCGAWIEWAGVAWLALGSLERHDCAPFLEARERRPAARVIGGRLQLDPEVVQVPARSAAARPMRLEVLPLVQPVIPAEPRWASQLGALIFAAAAVLAFLFAWALVSHRWT